MSAFFVCQRAGHHILLEYLVEVVGVAEADGVGYLGHRHIGSAKKVHSRVYSHTVDIIDRCLAYALLKHLGKIVGRKRNHIGKSFDIYFLRIVPCDIFDYRAKPDNIVVDHSIHLITRAGIISQDRR